MKILLLVIVCCIHFGSMAQNWSYLESNEIYGISVSESSFEDKSADISHARLIFKYENFSDSELELTFNREVAYGADFIQQEQDFKVIIPAKSSVEYTTENANDKTYYLFVKDKNGHIKSTLRDFRITNIKHN
ncbi:MAG TPA: hypothetical protein VKZ44_01585 [Taishania sp.]|nr:hypothetical protein [Taishania sp.]